MIDKKKIEAAAQGFCDATYGTLNDSPHIAEGFKQGANWAIQEFLKDLWHPMTEEPVPHGDEKDEIYPHVKCIVESYWEYGVRQWNPTDKCWDTEDGDDYEYDMDCVKRWCYLDDILPQKGGEE